MDIYCPTCCLPGDGNVFARSQDVTRGQNKTISTQSCNFIHVQYLQPKPYTVSKHEQSIRAQCFLPWIFNYACILSRDIEK